MENKEKEKIDIIPSIPKIVVPGINKVSIKIKIIPKTNNNPNIKISIF